MDDVLKAILDGKVDDAKPKLADLSVDQLNALHEAEEGGQKRSTMLAAIHAELKTRGGANDGGANQQSGGELSEAPSDAKIYTQAEWDAREQQHRDAVAIRYSQQDVDEILTKFKLQRDAEQQRAVAEATGTTAPTVNAGGYSPLVLDKAGEKPGPFATTNGTTIVFVDDEDRPIKWIPAMSFVPADFERSGDAVTLIREVDFPKELPIAEVSGAFLLDDEDDPIGKATLVMPFQVGGGRTAKLAQSSLQFAA